MFDGNMAARIIYATLAADTTLAALHNGIVEDIWAVDALAPASAYPFIAISVMEQSDHYYNGRARAMTEQRILIRAIQQFTSDGSYAGTLQTIADRIDTVLHNKCLAITEGVTTVGQASIWREQPYRERYIDGSIEYRHLGGIYNVTTNEN